MGFFVFSKQINCKTAVFKETITAVFCKSDHQGHFAVFLKIALSLYFLSMFIKLACNVLIGIQGLLKTSDS